MELILIEKIRTNNFHDEQVMTKIANMWKNAFAVLSSHKDITYGLYHEYASDYKGDYTLAVAVEGKNETSITIPDHTVYKAFNVDTSNEYGIVNTWHKIWKEEEEGELQRAYTYDFEKYFPDGRITIYIAVIA